VSPDTDVVGGGGDLEGPAGPVKRNFESKFELRWLGIFLPNPNPPLFLSLLTSH